MAIEIQETCIILNRLEQKRSSPRHIIINLLNVQNKDIISNTAMLKSKGAYKGSSIRITPHLSGDSKSQKDLDRCSTDSRRPQMPVETAILSKNFNHNT